MTDAAAEVAWSDRMRRGGEQLRLGDGVEVAPLVQLQVDVAERLQPAAEPAAGTTHPLGDRTDLAAPLGEQVHDPVGLPSL
jgi:hypothetical protein